MKYCVNKRMFYAYLARKAAWKLLNSLTTSAILSSGGRIVDRKW